MVMNTFANHPISQARQSSHEMTPIIAIGYLALILKASGAVLRPDFAEIKDYDPQNKCPCSRPPVLMKKKLYGPVTIAETPAYGGCSSPYVLANDACIPTKDLEPSPIIFESFVQYKIEFLARFRWLVYSPQYNWFYDPKLWVGQTPCSAFKQANSGIDATLFEPGSLIPVCSTIKKVDDFFVFLKDNSEDCNELKSENYIVTCTRVGYALNLVSGCGEMRTVVLSKDVDEFPPSYAFRLAYNPQNSHYKKLKRLEAKDKAAEKKLKDAKTSKDEVQKEDSINDS